MYTYYLDDIRIIARYNQQLGRSPRYCDWNWRNSEESREIPEQLRK